MSIGLHGLVCASRCRPSRRTHDFKLVRVLGGVQLEAFKGVRSKDGTIITDKNIAKLRWQEHFTALFSADVLADVKPLCVPTGAEACDHNFNPTIDDILKAIARLNPRKAVGPDGICAGLLHAGGTLLAAQLHDLVKPIVQVQCVLYQLRGGALRESFKGKGDPWCVIPSGGS